MTRRIVLVAAFLCVCRLAQPVLAQTKKPATAAEEMTDPAEEINTPAPGARKISFETSSGTWMSVDVSPDGRTLLFDLLGDIYALSVDSGAARAVSSGPAFDSHPRFSPDGKTIAFTSDEGGIANLWFMDADGKNRRIVIEDEDAYVRSAAWTPDGNYLVARREDATRAGIPPVELWLFHRHGGSGIKLTSSDDLNSASGPVLSRDGRFVYFAARRRPFNYTPSFSGGLWNIFRYDRKTGDSVPITSGLGGAARPALSPDSETLFFVSRRDASTVLVARTLATGAEKVIASGLTRDDQEGFTPMDVWPNYAVMPDGSALVFSDRGKLVRLDLKSFARADIPFKVQVEQYAAPVVLRQDKVETGPVRARILRWTSQSPDGRWVAFDAFGSVWLQEISAGKATGAPRKLTDSGPTRQYAPAFSPDGKWVAFVSWNDREGGHVWKAGVPGAGESGAAIRLTIAPGHYANPSWSPRSDRLAIVRGSGLEFRGQQPEEESHFEVRWLDASGGDTHYVTTVELSNSMRFHPQAFWSSDGTRLYHRVPVEQEKPTDPLLNDLVSVRLDGTDQKTHLRLPPVDDVVPSPDEKWVVFTSRDNVYVTALPDTQTDEPAEVNMKEDSVPVWRLSDAAGGFVAWADGGRTITWSLGNVFHRLSLESAIQFVEEEKKRKKEEEKKSEARSEKRDDESGKDEDEDEVKVPPSEQIEIALEAPRSVPEGAFVLRGARVLTMSRPQPTANTAATPPAPSRTRRANPRRIEAPPPAPSTPEIIERADLVVKGNRIAAIGESGKVDVPAGAREFDARGTTIVPGFIDTHAHLHYSGFEIFPETKWEYVANLAYGVTSVYDPSAPSLDVFAQAEMVEAGIMTGPRVYSSGDVLYGGQNAPMFAEVNSLADARRQVRRMKAYGARMIKVYQQPRREQRIWFAAAARELGMLLTAEGAGEFDTDITTALDGFTAFEHSLPFEIHDDAVQFLARSGTYYTPTLLVSYGGPTAEHFFWQTRAPHDDPKLNLFVPHRTLDAWRRRVWITPEDYHFPTVARGAAAVANAGGRVTMGAHGQLQGLGVHWEIWALAGEGVPLESPTTTTNGNGADGRNAAMTPMQALRASTIVAAEKIGYGQDLGSLEPGKLADLVVLDANPLDDIHNTATVRWVIKNGELYDASTMKQEWPRERPLPPFFWKQ